MAILSEDKYFFFLLLYNILYYCIYYVHYFVLYKYSFYLLYRKKESNILAEQSYMFYNENIYIKKMKYIYKKE